jgi:CMP-N,N'-diacetyllegionaminic acid synthase
VSAEIGRGSVLAIVPARGGSKGLPGKNVRVLAGHPLIAWSIAAGQCAESVDRVICSTDDPDIAAVATQYGAQVPFMRPSEFATDVATDLDVMSHALKWLVESEGYCPEWVVQLRPTTPFRDAEWIDAAVAVMRADTRITCVRSVAPTPLTPYKMWKRIEGEYDRLYPLLELAGCPEPYNMPRQGLPVVYWHTGQLDVIRTDTILSGSMTGDVIHAFDVPVDRAVDIDTLNDFQFAELTASAMQSPAITLHLRVT